MKFCALVGIASAILFHTQVLATPPACLLSCLNNYARWCPNNHSDITCFIQNTEVMIACFNAECAQEDFDAAKDHFLGVLEGFSNPGEGEGQAPETPVEDEPLPDEGSKKHKPPKYGHKTSSYYKSGDPARRRLK